MLNNQYDEHMVVNFRMRLRGINIMYIDIEALQRGSPVISGSR